MSKGIVLCVFMLNLAGCATTSSEFWQNLSAGLGQAHDNLCAQARANQTTNMNATCYTSGGITQCSGQAAPSQIPADCN